EYYCSSYAGSNIYIF
nr:immunoglobulin light chain junction region [Macaca mulatta]MOW02459.1 immunoglobulin light chain junction region [Macaca mulatta]MOW02557.1 immunoglobulin light chain junction region [Macaca mulatta]MOW02613.1 immunoglobulin light chain junction region [Macaca mulatta]MOW02757.1 immunoglobulin light chain junction region [Macaca mulatta]